MRDRIRRGSLRKAAGTAAKLAAFAASLGVILFAAERISNPDTDARDNTTATIQAPMSSLLTPQFAPSPADRGGDRQPEETAAIVAPQMPMPAPEPDSASDARGGDRITETEVDAVALPPRPLQRVVAVRRGDTLMDIARRSPRSGERTGQRLRPARFATRPGDHLHLRPRRPWRRTTACRSMAGGTCGP